VNRTDVMIQRGQRLRFPLEASHPIGAGGELLGQNLDGHVAFELRVTGAVHLSHATVPELPGDLVGTDSRT
jgi:hypothetical protein